MTLSERPLSVVVPCFNEESTVREILSQVFESDLVGEVILIDDGSSDATWEVVSSIHPPEGIAFVRHRSSKNSGKGAALAKGFSLVSKDIIIIQDADLEYSPLDYGKLLAPIISGDADVVYGSRFLSGEARRVLYFWHFLGNKLLTLISNMVTNLNLSDMETGYKAMRADYVKKLLLREKRFGIEPELTAKLAIRKARFYEVSIGYRGRTYSEGKKIGWKDGIWAFVCIFRYGILGRLKK